MAGERRISGLFPAGFGRARAARNGLSPRSAEACFPQSARVLCGEYSSTCRRVRRRKLRLASRPAAFRCRVSVVVPHVVVPHVSSSHSLGFPLHVPASRSLFTFPHVPASRSRIMFPLHVPSRSRLTSPLHVPSPRSCLTFPPHVPASRSLGFATRGC